MNRASSRLTILFAAFFAFVLLLNSTQADSIVHFSYSYDGLAIGGYDVQTFSGDTPLTTKNFLRYVNNGVYDNTILDRDSYNYIIQGGGFTLKDRTSQEYYPQAAPLYDVPTYDPIANEPGVSNLRGTIAMTKLSDNPNSATSQWYVNLSDNTTLDNPSNNGGYTVFGKILGQGMNFFDDVDKNNPYITFTDISGTYGKPALTEVPMYINEDNHYLFIKLVHAAVTPAPWNGSPTVSSDWGEKANWGGVYNNVCVPDGPGSKISLDNQTTTVNTLDMATVGRTVGSLKFTGDSTLISSSGGFNLTLDNIDQPVEIDVTGSHTISAPVVLAGDAKIFGSGVLNLTAGISGGHTLTVSSGTLIASSIQADSLIIGTPPVIIPTIAWKGGGNASNDWSVAANWDSNSGAPCGAGCKVAFGNQTAEDNVVDLKTADQTVGCMSFAAQTSTTIASSGQHLLLLDNLADVAEIDVAGSHTIAVPVVLAGDAMISGPGTLSMTSGISGDHALTVSNGTLIASSIQVNTLNIGNTNQVVAVPEPSMAVLFSVSLTGLFFAFCRSKR